MTIRFNSDKAGTTEIGYSQAHDIDDAFNAGTACYETFGCCGVAILVIVALGAALAAGASETSSSHCWEVCSYDEVGRGVCQCLFG